MPRVFLLLGSNLGDRVAEISRARELIEAKIAPLSCFSKIYESAPWGCPHQPQFLNQALELSSNETPLQILKNCLKIEQIMGRKRGQHYAPRTIDIDLLYYGEEAVHHPEITLPHPKIEERRFTLVAMAEIAPNWTHPLLNKSQLELLEACNDPLEVQVFQPPLQEHS